MKINSTYIPFMLELNPGSQLGGKLSEKKKSEKQTRKILLLYFTKGIISGLWHL